MAGSCEKFKLEIRQAFCKVRTADPGDDFVEEEVDSSPPRLSWSGCLSVQHTSALMLFIFSVDS